ncbi:MAG: hypothetical protein IJX85_05160 [Lachnospiraceae bacterium]|nr:hypothetical protein [Lachnospiraceae bacterium]
MLINLIVSEVKHDILRHKWRYFSFFLFMTITILGKCFYMSEAGIGDFGIFGLNASNILLGIPRYVFYADNQIVVPAGWIVMLLFIPFIVGDWCEYELCGIGVYKILLSGRKNWWIAKFTSVFVGAIIYIAIYFLSQILITIILNGDLIEASDDIWLYNSGYSRMLSEITTFYLYTIAMPCVSFITFFVCSFVLSLICGSVKSFMMITIYIVLGVFYTSPYFIGNQLMLLRSTHFDSQGIDIIDSIFIDLILIIGGYAIGRSYIHNKDLI